MPTYAFTRTRERVRDLVARKLSIIGAGETLSGDDAAVIDEAMSLRMHELQAMDMLWWRVAAAQTDLELTSGDAAAAVVETDFLFPVSLMLGIGTEQQQLRIIDHRAYQAIPDKAQTGEPEVAFFSGPDVLLWPVPNQDYTAKLTYQAIAEDLETGEPIDVPLAMLRPFSVLVASDLLDEFQASPKLSASIMVKVEPSMRAIRALNVQRVDSETVAPDYF